MIVLTGFIGMQLRQVSIGSAAVTGLAASEYLHLTVVAAIEFVAIGLAHVIGLLQNMLSPSAIWIVSLKANTIYH